MLRPSSLPNGSSSSLAWFARVRATPALLRQSTHTAISLYFIYNTPFCFLTLLSTSSHFLPLPLVADGGLLTCHAITAISHHDQNGAEIDFPSSAWHSKEMSPLYTCTTQRCCCRLLRVDGVVETLIQSCLEQACALKNIRGDDGCLSASFRSRDAELSFHRFLSLLVPQSKYAQQRLPLSPSSLRTSGG